MNEWRFPIPAKLNGPQLIKELNLSDLYTDGDQLVLVCELTKDQAAAGLAAHVPQPTQAEIDAQMKVDIGERMTSLTYMPLLPEQIAWLGKQLS